MSSAFDNGQSVDITGLDKGLVVASLFNASKPAAAFDDRRLTTSGLDASTPVPPMTVEEGQAEFDRYRGQLPAYVRGRLMRVDVSGDNFDPGGYDRDHGTGAAAKAITPLMRELHRGSGPATDGPQL